MTIAYKEPLSRGTLFLLSYYLRYLRTLSVEYIAIKSMILFVFESTMIEHMPSLSYMPISLYFISFVVYSGVIDINY